MKNLVLILIILFPLLGAGQTIQRLEAAEHSISINGDSLTIFQEAQFYCTVDWYVDSSHVGNSGETITLSIYYEPEPFPGTFEYTSITKDTFGISGLSMGAHPLIVNSYDLSDSLDHNNIPHVFPMLRDSHTSYFQVLSDHSISFTESPVSFYPNPAKEKLTLHGLKPEDGEVEVSILSLTGKTVLETTVSHSNLEIDLSGLPKGSYIFKTPHSGPQIFLVQ